MPKFKMLSEIKKGEKFFLRSYLYVAYENASIKNGYVGIDAGRQNEKMSSGFELSTISLEPDCKVELNKS